MTEANQSDPWASADTVMHEIRALSVDCTETRLNEATRDAAFYQSDIGTLLIAIKGCDPGELLELVLLATLACPSVMSRAMALVRPPDSLW